jgi:hypothetical protein
VRSLLLAPMTGAADRTALINRQRRHLINLMRGLTEPAAERDNPIAVLLAEGARSHLRADLDWLQRCQEEPA